MRMRLNGVERVWWLVAVAMTTTALGCAQQVGDIDRTSPNALRKSDFTEGEWYIRQTFSEVPPASLASFVGETSGMEKIRWEITEDYLIAYRSYIANPGSLTGDVSVDENGEPSWLEGAEEGYGEAFRESAVAAYPISSHFDIQRQYNSSTGEQSNVIVENSSDRHWYETEYFRVNWSNALTSFTLFDNYFFEGLSFYVQPSEESSDSLVMEFWGLDAEGEEITRNIPGIDGDDYEQGDLYYLDFTNRIVLDPGYSYCWAWMGWTTYTLDDCAASEVEVRTSVLRVPEASDYEPIFYDDVDNAKYGIFRTERLAYDRRYGERIPNQIQLANRHNIWSNTWQRNADGSLVRDAEGRAIPNAMADRTPRPLVYHTSVNYPETLWDETTQLADDWDRAFRRTVSAAQGIPYEQTPRMFYVCHNPVLQDDLAECGDVGLSPRVGDLRYNFIYWVENPQMVSPLGYGPSSADPETGEIIAAMAYVYGAGVDEYAQAALDIVRFLNGDLTLDDFENGDYIRDDILRRLDPNVNPRGLVDARLGEIEIGDSFDPRDVMPESGRAVLDYVEEFGLNDFAARPQAIQQRFDLIEESGAGALALDSEVMTALGVDRIEDLPTDVRDSYFRNGLLLPRVLNESRSRNIAAERNAVCFDQFNNLDDTSLGLAMTFRGRTDYDNIWEELRGLIYRGVQSHEVGHTLGLWHNFQASYDSLNYFDRYWELKTAGVYGLTDDGSTTIVPFRRPQYLSDIYGMATMTPAQTEGRMREYQYSSIMDYHSAFNTDIQGIGRYDEAAVIYAYTSGRDRTVTDFDPSHPLYNTQERGYVEVFNNVGDAREFFEAWEGLDSPAYPELLEKFHYSTIATAMASDGGAWESDSYVPDPATIRARMRDRSLMRLADVHDMRATGAAGRPIEVPYLYLSHGWLGASQSTRVYDQGADPLEQALDLIERYRTFYVFDYFRRERLNWDQFYIFDRLAGRYMLNFVDNYQRWLFDVAFSATYDPIIDNAWTFGAYASLNIMAEIMTTPSYGSYQLDDTTDTYVLTSYSDGEGELYIPPGDGRRPYSTYDPDLGYLYWLYPSEAGHFWAYYAAVIILSSSSTVAVRGADVGADFLSYSIPPFLVFEEEMTRLYNGLWLEDNRSIAPVATRNGTNELQMERRMFSPIALTSGEYLDPETGFITAAVMESDLGADVGTTIDVMQGFTYRYLPLLYGMAFFDTNFSLHFHDQAKIFRLGSGESLVAGEGYDVVQVCDPFALGGVCYAALSRQGETDPSAAVRIINRTQQALDEYNCLDELGASCELVDVAPADVESEMNTRMFDIQNQVEYMNMMRGLYEIFGNPW